jgi:hypothetical protein
MKFKLAFAMAAAVFAGTFAFGSAKAWVVPDPVCFGNCVQQLRACLAATPDKADLCYAYDRQCKLACGSNL